MAKYLDKAGLQTVFSKIKLYVDNAIGVGLLTIKAANTTVAEFSANSRSNITISFIGTNENASTSKGAITVDKTTNTNANEIQIDTTATHDSMLIEGSKTDTDTTESIFGAFAAAGYEL